ncbi:MAG: hypothetical protein LAO24_10715 [Acidobacteriia bacterium]|nr:hypothetical protein [Terriglobia bacterium]
MKLPAGIRRGWAGAACGLLLACLWVPAASARPQTSTASSTSSKPTTTTKKKHRKTTTQSAGKSAGATSPKVASKGKRSSRRRVRGQQKIDSERARAIQEALIREHYLSGEPAGAWNQASEDAMRRYQADHGWQSKTVPDSRALIKLGLGPSHDHLLNPESAMTTVPDGPRTASSNSRAQSADPIVPPSKAPSVDPSPAATSTPADSSGPQ